MLRFPTGRYGVIRAMTVTCVIALTACAASSGQSKTPTAGQTVSQKAAAEQEKKDQKKLICSYERPTGSHIPEKICRIPAQVDAEREATQQMIREQQQSQTTRGGG
jgi:hypothetical protein